MEQNLKKIQQTFPRKHSDGDKKSGFELNLWSNEFHDSINKQTKIR